MERRGGTDSRHSESERTLPDVERRGASIFYATMQYETMRDSGCRFFRSSETHELGQIYQLLQGISRRPHHENGKRIQSVGAYMSRKSGHRVSDAEAGKALSHITYSRAIHVKNVLQMPSPLPSLG